MLKLIVCCHFVFWFAIAGANKIYCCCYILAILAISLHNIEWSQWIWFYLWRKPIQNGNELCTARENKMDTNSNRQNFIISGYHIANACSPSLFLYYIYIIIEQKIQKKFVRWVRSMKFVRTRYVPKHPKHSAKQCKRMSVFD